jgi:hypothetical protein
MRKAMPFVATALVSVLITAGIMQATAGAQVDPSLSATGLSASRVLGLGLSIETCNTSPSNASAWLKFAKCTTGNFTAIKRWANKLDTCITTFEVEKRADLAIYQDGLLTNPGGEALNDYDGNGPFRYFMGWKDLAACPTT